MEIGRLNSSSPISTLHSLNLSFSSFAAQPLNFLFQAAQLRAHFLQLLLLGALRRRPGLAQRIRGAAGDDCANQRRAAAPSVQRHPHPGAPRGPPMPEGRKKDDTRDKTPPHQKAKPPNRGLLQDRGQGKGPSPPEIVLSLSAVHFFYGLVRWLK